MNKSDLAKGLLTVPAITTGVDLLTQSPVGEAVSNVVSLTGSILNTGNSLLNPLFATVAGGASAGLLTNTILKDLGVEKKWLKYSLNGVATLGGLAGGSAIAPYLAAGWASYAISKFGWKYGDKVLKFLGKTVVTPFVGIYGFGKGAINGAVKGSKEEVSKFWTKSA